MTPSYAVKRGVRYRYYVSRAVTEGQKDLAGSIVRVPAVDVEEAVLAALGAVAAKADDGRWSRMLRDRPNRVDPANTTAPSTTALPPSPEPAQAERAVGRRVQRIDVRNRAAFGKPPPR